MRSSAPGRGSGCHGHVAAPRAGRRSAVGRVERLPATARSAVGRPFGAAPVDGAVEFRVWAPGAERVAVRVAAATTRSRPRATASGRRSSTAGGGRRLPVRARRSGAGPIPARACSRRASAGRRASWTPARSAGATAAGRASRSTISFSTSCTSARSRTRARSTRSIPHLAELRELGVTAIELMPVATFPGERGWGYDGVYTYAPHPAYGGPEGLARFVDAAHAAGLGVFLDVVYNHIGPGSEALAAFGPYFTDRYETFWGDGARLRAAGRPRVGDPERRHVGARLPRRRPPARRDARDLRRQPAARAGRARATGCARERPARSSIAEMEPGDPQPIEEWGHDAQWGDELHHALHVLLTGEREGYYASFGSGRGARRACSTDGRPSAGRLRAEPRPGRQPRRRRPPRPAGRAPRSRAAVTLFAPQTPLLFMGEEYGEQRAVPVLHRPHRPGDRRRDPRGPAQGVRAFTAVLRRGGARPAGPGDLRALEADP